MISTLHQFLTLACATCMADRGGVVQKAANLGIWMMLAALALIFSCLGLVVFNIARRARRVKLLTPR